MVNQEIKGKGRHCEACIGFIYGAFEHLPYDEEILSAFILNAVNAYSLNVLMLTDADLATLPLPGQLWKNIAMRMKQYSGTYLQTVSRVKNDDNNFPSIIHV